MIFSANVNMFCLCREPVALLTIMCYLMRTGSLLMACRFLPTICATRMYIMISLLDRFPLDIALFQFCAPNNLFWFFNFTLLNSSDMQGARAQFP